VIRDDRFAHHSIYITAINNPTDPDSIYIMNLTMKMTTYFLHKLH